VPVSQRFGTTASRSAFSPVARLWSRRQWGNLRPQLPVSGSNPLPTTHQPKHGSAGDGTNDQPARRVARCMGAPDPGAPLHIAAYLGTEALTPSVLVFFIIKFGAPVGTGLLTSRMRSICRAGSGTGCGGREGTDGTHDQRGMDRWRNGYHPPLYPNAVVAR
jgi:hypothetical protein